jgi:hypothetical protein
MRISKVFAVLALCAAAAPVAAEQRVTLGWGRMFSNDALGDGHDRWRTGSYQLSMLRGVSFDGDLPKSFGSLIEYRASSQIIAPASLTTAAATDRRYVGMLSLGAHSQFDWQGNDVSLGGDLVITGPQTGISNFQKWVHNALGMAEPLVVSNQLGNAVYPTVLGEIGRTVAVTPQVTLRPFAEAQAGVESFVRVGGDMVVGSFGRGTVMARDMTTGQRYRVAESQINQGISFVLGGDIARVFDSALLPSTGGAVMSDDRGRVRAGVHWQGDKTSLYYGVSYLSPEFESQSEGQVIGSLSLNLKF